MAYGEVFVTKRDIETKLASVGDYVKIDFLMQCLKKNLDFDTKKFVMLKLADVYESKKMYQEAGKLVRAAADINTTFEGKTKDFMRSFNLFVKAGIFDEAEVSYSKAIASANNSQKIEIKQSKKKSIKDYAEENFKKDRRRQAMEAYELLLSIDLLPAEKQETQNKLLSLYERLGKIKEYGALRNAIRNPSAQTQSNERPVPQRKNQERPRESKVNESIDQLLSSLD